MRLSRWKKYAPHLIIMVTLIAVAVPTLGSHALNELSPYLALSEELVKPEAIVADRMEIVDRTYIDDDPAKGWETVTWAFKLEVTNRGDEVIILPAANVTLYYLDDLLGTGFISEKYEIDAGKSKMVNLYMVMENNRISKTWFTALILGEPLDLTAIFEPYILVDGPNDEPFLPLNMVQELEFSFPHQSRGPAPFIHSITRAPVSANQPVSVSVSATDEGTGISNRTYIYYSINNGITWNQIVMTGGEWWDRYNYYIDENGVPHGLLGGYYPIRSTLEEETYEGEIPGLPSGTNVLFKVYLEDYAGNHEHKKTANWVESQIYSYIVPSAGALPEFSQKFTQNTKPSSTDKFFDYLELNGINLMNYLYLNNINAFTIPAKLPNIAKFFYTHDLDTSYAMGMNNIDSDKGADIMSDSGISSGYLLVLFGLSLDDFFDYLVEHIFLPTKHDLATQAKNILDEWYIIDEIEPWTSTWISEGDVLNDYWFIPHGKIWNVGEDHMGLYRLFWNITDASTLGRSFLPNPLDLSRSDYLTFMLDYGPYVETPPKPPYDPLHYQRLNGNLSVILTDNNGRTMTSNQIYFQDDGSTLPVAKPQFPYQQHPDQQITLGLNSGEFTIESGFNFGAITDMNFTYSGNLPVNVWLDYICAYSSKAYEVHQYFTYEVAFSHEEMKIWLFGRPTTAAAWINGIFWGIAASGIVLRMKDDPIIEDWEINPSRTGGWNWLDLIATDNGTIALELGELGELGKINQHLTAANLMVEDRSTFPYGDLKITFGPRVPINFYEKLCSLLGIEIDEFDDEPIMKEEIYPYTHAVAMSMVYIPLGAVAALATVLSVRRYRIRKKIQKVRKKYTKKLKG